MKIRHTALVASAVVVLSACGAGGSGGTATSSSVATTATTAASATTEAPSTVGTTTTEAPSTAGTSTAGTTAEAAADTETTTSAGTASSAATPSHPAADTSASATQPARLGTVRRFPDGLTVTASTPTRLHPAPSSEVPGASMYVAIDITVKNGTSKPVDASYATITGRSGGALARRFYEDSLGLRMSDYETIPAGETARWKVGYALPSMSGFVLDVEPDLEHGVVRFTG